MTADFNSWGIVLLIFPALARDYWDDLSQHGRLVVTHTIFPP